MRGGGNLLKQDPGTLELNVCLKEKEKTSRL